MEFELMSAKESCLRKLVLEIR